jgi:CRP/FNR family transcriptional regulator, cyclic AMP receptor protein
LSDFASELVKEKYKAGDFVFFEGDVDFHFYIVEQGEVEVFTKNKSGKRIQLLLAEKGESFGEFALLDKKPRSASAQAKTDCVLIKVTEQGYNQLLADIPVWASSMLKSFAQRLRSMNDKIKGVDLPQFVDYKT